MKNIVLIGMMGCGKTTVGKLLSKKLHRPLIDTDELIVSFEQRPVSQIFAQNGEDYFRTQERITAGELAQKTGLIISCGGGLPTREDAIRPLWESGIVFWLNRDPAETYDALDTSGRPLAQNGREDFLARYAQRAPVYGKWAHYVISNAPSAETAARAITSILKSEEK